MERFRKVTKREPCPVCGHDDWCVVSKDGGTAICMRQPSDRPNGNGGWVHVLREMPRQERRVRRAAAHAATPHVVDMSRVMDGFRAEYEGDGVTTDLFASGIELGRELGLPGAVVDRLGCGRSRFYGAWAFPMRDGDGSVVGVRLRAYGSSDKWSVTGSRDGLFYDPDLDAEVRVDSIKGRELVIVEGASDCAAGYAIGLPCVGRSSCSTGVAHLRRLCSRLCVERLTIVEDSDTFKARISIGRPGVPPSRTVFRPGSDGAVALANAVCRMYRIVTPPTKDLREWVRRGLTRREFDFFASEHAWRLPTTRGDQWN